MGFGAWVVAIAKQTSKWILEGAIFFLGHDGEYLYGWI